MDINIHEGSIRRIDTTVSTKEMITDVDVCIHCRSILCHTCKLCTFRLVLAHFKSHETTRAKDFEPFRLKKNVALKVLSFISSSIISNMMVTEK